MNFENFSQNDSLGTLPMIAYTDMEEAVKAEVMEIATNACEKYLNDNQSVYVC